MKIIEYKKKTPGESIKGLIICVNKFCEMPLIDPEILSAATGVG